MRKNTLSIIALRETLSSLFRGSFGCSKSLDLLRVAYTWAVCGIAYFTELTKWRWRTARSLAHCTRHCASAVGHINSAIDQSEWMSHATSGTASAAFSLQCCSSDRNDDSGDASWHYYCVCRPHGYTFIVVVVVVVLAIVANANKSEQCDAS